MMPVIEHGENDLKNWAFEWWLKSHYKGKEVCTETGLALWWQKYCPWSRLREKFRDEFLSSPKKFFYFMEYDDDGRNYTVEVIDPAGYVHFIETKEMLGYVHALKNKPRQINPSIVQRSEIKVMPNGAMLMSSEEMKRISLMSTLNQ